MSMRPLRVLQVLRSPIGGLYRHVVDLSGELVKRGHHFGLVMDSSLSDPQTQERLKPLEPLLELGVHRLPIPRLLGIADITTPFALKRLARQLDVDIIHGHGAKGGLHGRLAGWGMKGVRTIYTPHGGVLHFDKNALSGRIFYKIERALLAQTDAIAFESAHAQKRYAEQVGQPKCLSAVVHNGLAEAEFEPVGTDPNPYDFGFVGELRDLKGIFYLLDALAEVRRGDGTQANLVVAGDGPAKDEFVKKIAAYGLEAHVSLIGVQPARTVFAKARSVVVPSLAESLPYVVLEAAAAAKPVIATRVGGIPEIFGPTEQALVAPADSDALRVAMQAFMDAPEQADKLMRQRLKYVRAGFSVSRMCDGIEALYRGHQPPR